MHLHLPFAGRRPQGAIGLHRPAASDPKLDELHAELTAVLVDLEARARFGKIEGVALPLLEHAKNLSRRFAQRAAAADDAARKRFGPEAERLQRQLAAVECALEALSTPQPPRPEQPPAP